MNRKYLLPETGNFYKANLHCHTTNSDGSFTPEEIKKFYKEKGYSVVAFTDHNVVVSQQHLNDEKFLALNGMEVDISEKHDESMPQSGYNKTCHICFIALKPDNLETFCYHREKYLTKGALKYRDTLLFDETLPDFERKYTAECVNEVIKTGRDKGFFVTYNHPTWSMEFYPEYMSYHGMHAMEIYNCDCCFPGHYEYNEHEYRDMLRGGEKIYCVATDDNHGLLDMFGGFTMIKADELKYEVITDALLKGNFYASTGPEIKSLWYEDGKIVVECSEVSEIALNTKYRRCDRRAEENLTRAEFEVQETDGYVRLRLTDKYGNHANTNAYFIEDLMK